MTRVATFPHKIVLILLFMCPLKDKWTVATLCLWWRVYSWLTTCNNLQQLYFRWTLSTPSQRMVSNVLENDLPVSALRWQSYPNEFKSYFPTWEIHLQRIYTQRQPIYSWPKNISDQQVQVTVRDHEKNDLLKHLKDRITWAVLFVSQRLFLHSQRICVMSKQQRSISIYK